jgi:phospho-N-acetylmuramoyl-pentapeptide-transferase
MLYYLYEYLFPLGKEIRFFKIFNVFQYTTFRAIMAVITALLISFIIGPKIIRYLRSKKIGQYVRELGPQTHHSKTGTPTMGGIIMIVSVLISTLLWARPDNPFIWICLFSMLGFGLIGFLDDYLKLIKKSPAGLAGHLKLLGQFTFALIISIWLYHIVPSTIYVPFFSEPVLNMGIFFVIFSILVMVGSSNAVNLTDGLDGLAIGLSLLVVGTFGIFAYLTGHGGIADYLNIPFIPGASEVSVYMGGMAGAGLGFLWYNSHPAEVFMGDTGSLFLGGTLGTVAVILKKEFLLFLVGGIFVVEAASVILQVLVFKKTGKRLFRMAPLHHHFELKGWPESKIIARFWIIGIILSLFGLATLKLQ